MKKLILLKDSIEILKKVKIELHDSIESSDLVEIDFVINQLEYYVENEDTSIERSDFLLLLGRVLAVIPALKKFFDYLTQL